MKKRGFFGIASIVVIAVGILIIFLLKYPGENTDDSQVNAPENLTSSGNQTLMQSNNLSIQNASNQTNSNQTAEINQTNQTNQGAAGLADLVIESFNFTSINSTFVDNSTNTTVVYYDISLTANIKNTGGSSTAASTTRFWLDETWRSAVTKVLAAGESVELTTTFNNWSRGGYSALVKADWNSVIDESNEDNNAATIQIEL